MLIFLALIISNFFVPFNKNHGIEFNTERIRFGIPLIGDDWEKDEFKSGIYKTHWLKPGP